MPLWWSGMVVAALLTTYTPLEPFWPISRMEAAVDEVAFSRKKYDAFRKMIQREITSRPALVLIEPDPADRHIDYIVNDPALEADVLYGRYRPGKTDPANIVRLFPNRRCYLYRVKSRQLARLTLTR